MATSRSFESTKPMVSRRPDLYVLHPSGEIESEARAVAQGLTSHVGQLLQARAGRELGEHA